MVRFDSSEMVLPLYSTIALVVKLPLKIIPLHNFRWQNDDS